MPTRARGRPSLPLPVLSSPNRVWNSGRERTQGVQIEFAPQQGTGRVSLACMASGYAQPPVARATRESQDFARLERAVRALAAEHALLRGENVELREKLDQATVRIRSQDERILAENQRRQDVLKRLDELLGRIDPRSPEPAGAHVGRR